MSRFCEVLHIDLLKNEWYTSTIKSKGETKKPQAIDTVHWQINTKK